MDIDDISRLVQMIDAARAGATAHELSQVTITLAVDLDDQLLQRINAQLSAPNVVKERERQIRLASRKPSGPDPKSSWRRTTSKSPT